MKEMEITFDIQEALNKKAKIKGVLLNILPFAGLVFIIIFFVIVTQGQLFSSTNLINLVNQSFTVSIVAVGAAFVYAHGGFDFSIGSSSGLIQFICAVLIVKFGFPIWVGILAAIVVSVLNSIIVGGEIGRAHV